METITSESNLIITTRKERIQHFLKVYGKVITVIITPFVWMPIAFLGKNKAYLSLYVFLVNATYLVVNVFHPGVTSLIPIAMITTLSSMGRPIISSIKIGNSVVECFGVMMTIIAIENSKLHKRIAIKILIIFGCSHFRLSFLLFFSTMVLSMWFTNIMACGLMMPLVKAVLYELENMGVLETYEAQKAENTSYDNDESMPTDFTTFYFLGIAYSSTIVILLLIAMIFYNKKSCKIIINFFIGGLYLFFLSIYGWAMVCLFQGWTFKTDFPVGGVSTLIGSETNQLFKKYCEIIFPLSPSLEVPHIMLLTLPGVIIMELCLYLWLNFYFLGMLRVQSYTSMQTSLTNEEEQFISMLLVAQYRQLGKIKFHEIIVGSSVMLTAILQATLSFTNLTVDRETLKMYSISKFHAPSIICAVLFFVMPVNLDFIKTLTHTGGNVGIKSFQTCLSWSLVKKNIHWSVLLITASCNITFEALKHTRMDEEFEKFLSLFSALPAPALALIVIMFCKILTEFANNVIVAKYLLLNTANLSIFTKLNPRFLMVSVALATSLPFQLVSGTPANAMVAAYVGIPPLRMMIAGIGPSLISVLTTLFTVTVWSKVIWPDINTYPAWANVTKVNM